MTRHSSSSPGDGCFRPRLLAFLAILLAFAAGGGAWFRAQQEAQNQAQFAEQKAKQALEERDRALRNESLFLAGLAEQQVAAGNILQGIGLALTALPQDMNDPDARPYVAEAEKALYSALSKHWLIAVLSGHSAPVYYAAFDRDGGRILSVSEDGTARLWKASSGEALAVLHADLQEQVQQAFFSADGKRILVVLEKGPAVLWDASAAPPTELGRSAQAFGALRQAAFNAGGDRALLVSETGKTLLWDVVAGKPLSFLGDDGEAVVKAVFSPDGAQVLTRLKNGSTQLWDAETAENLRPLARFDRRVLDAVFSPDGKQVATLSSAMVIRLWNAETANQERILIGDRGDYFTRLGFDLDGKRLIAIGNSRIAVWDIGTGRRITALERGFCTHYACGFVAASLFDTAYGARLLAVSTDWSETFLSGLFSLSEQRLLTTVSSAAPPLLDSERAHLLTWGGSGLIDFPGSAQLWDARTGARLRRWGSVEAAVSSALLSPDGSQVLTMEDDGKIKLWTSDKGELAGVLDGHHGAIRRAAFSADGGRLVTASDDRTVRVWDIAVRDVEPLNKFPTVQSLIDYANAKGGERFSDEALRRFLKENW